MGITITIDSELIDLVDTMRQAQNHYFDIATDRSGKYQQHQRTRALQAAKAAEKRVDDWIKRYREEVRKLNGNADHHKTDEVQGTYLARIE